MKRLAAEARTPSSLSALLEYATNTHAALTELWLALSNDTRTESRCEAAKAIIYVYNEVLNMSTVFIRALEQQDARSNY